MAPELAVGPESALVRLVVASALGLFLGLEREWSHHSAGIRTFSLVALLGAAFTVLDRPGLLVVGGALVASLGVVLALRGLVVEAEGLSLTTAVSMLVAYAAGTLVGANQLLAGVTVAVVSSLLLVLKRELHGFAWGLTRAELRSATEFGVLAFVVYPALPAAPLTVRLAGLPLELRPRVVWLLVVSVAAIGIVNYAVVKSYGGRGIAVTGFVAGLVSSTAVVGTMRDHVRQYPDAVPFAVAAVLLADAAMAVRNLLVVLAFTLPDDALVETALPLGAVVVGAVAVAATTADWEESVAVELESPFSLRNVLGFGALFAVVLVGSGVATAVGGTTGLYAAAAVSGLVSSAGATSSAVLLYLGGGVSADATVTAVTVATVASVAVKAALAAASPSRTFARRVALVSAALCVAALAAGAVVAL